ncbi:diguanylate cyclase (GGDEF)-like protein [Methylopila jiangsuensis]|nr:EAL domain-containing protein [Methylopila jiangsuensis]MDR6285701.1 diguanylate cyclase (GGDEF)-like protein [Methylopila jiangsuensis]
MLKVVGCFVDQHNYGLVALAAVICAVSALAAIRLMRYAAARSDGARRIWLAVASLATGVGVWATHFIAMLAFEPGVPTGYDVSVTALSLVFAIFLTGFGLWIAIGPRPALGGAVFGAGVAVMHFTGMAAFKTQGALSWDAPLVLAAIGLGALFGALALPVARSTSPTKAHLGGALLLILAICSLHFTAMGAVVIAPDPRIAVPATALPTRWLAVVVAIAAFGILVLGFAALLLDMRERRKLLLERQRLQSLANASAEGLLICNARRILHANDNLAHMLGLETPELARIPLAELLHLRPEDLATHAASSAPFRTDLRDRSGGAVPVEIYVRPIELSQQPHFAIAVRDLRAQIAAEAEIRKLALFDSLTGLLNRSSFNQQVEDAVLAASAMTAKLAVLCIDLDRFKQINDLFGHAAGDDLLRSVGRALSGSLLEGEIAARLGGDEFAILAPVDHAVSAGAVAERVLRALSQAGGDHQAGVVRASVGVAIFPDDAYDRPSLLHNADVALYRAKAEQLGGYRFFEQTMSEELNDRRQTEHDLRHAADRGELYVVYQPQASVASSSIVGFEALVRWRRPGHGQMSPSTFIPLAEECGAILPIGEWVLRSVCREAAGWPNPLSVAVNVSAVQLHAPNFVALVHTVLFESGLPPQRLEIEITETALVRDFTRTLATLRQLKALGVRIAMDDFGTGYSSLSNLRAFPFDKIKIDRSFVTAVDSNQQAAAIVRSVLGLGRGLGLPVMAEGVETEAEMQFLQLEACDGAQGYLLGRPAPIDQFAHLTRANDVRLLSHAEDEPREQPAA